MAATPAAPSRDVVESAVGLADPDERRRVLQELRGELTDLLGRVQRGLDDSRLQEQGEAITESRVLDALRGEAELRAELVRRGLATDEQMAALGYPSHDDVDEHDASGTLREWAEDMLEEFSSIQPTHHLSGQEFNQRIRRAFHGRFAAGMGSPARRTDKALHHEGLGREMRSADGGHETPLAFGAERTAEVRKQLGDAPNTRVKHTKVIGGRRVYSTERRRLHRQIVERMLGQATPNERNADGSLKRTPEVMYLAGGPASGKSTALNLYAHPPEGAANLELDAFKGELPEFQALRDAGDPYASDAVHREASDIMAEAQREGERRGLSMIVDGVGNSGPGQFAQRLLASKAKGYKVHVFYADAPTKIAEDRSDQRAKDQKRVVPKEGLRAMHANVSRAFQEDVLPIADQLDSLEMYDTRGDNRKGELPVRHAHLEGGKLVIDDQQVHDEFRAKAGENPGSAVRHPSFI